MGSGGNFIIPVNVLHVLTLYQNKSPATLTCSCMCDRTCYMNNMSFDVACFFKIHVQELALCQWWVCITMVTPIHAHNIASRWFWLTPSLLQVESYTEAFIYCIDAFGVNRNRWILSSYTHVTPIHPRHSMARPGVSMQMYGVQNWSTACWRLAALVKQSFNKKTAVM